MASHYIIIYYIIFYNYISEIHNHYVFLMLCIYIQLLHIYAMYAMYNGHTLYNSMICIYLQWLHII